MSSVLAGIPSDQSSGTSSPLCDSGLHLNYHPNNTVRARRVRLLPDGLIPEPSSLVTQHLSLFGQGTFCFPCNCGPSSGSRTLSSLCVLLGDASPQRCWTARVLKAVCCVSIGHAVLLVLAYVSGAALGEEMGGPAPHSTAALPHVAVHPGVRLLQVSSGTAAGHCASFGRFLFGLFFAWQQVPRKLPCYSHRPQIILGHPVQEAPVPQHGQY